MDEFLNWGNRDGGHVREQAVAKDAHLSSLDIRSRVYGAKLKVTKPVMRVG